MRVFLGHAEGLSSFCFLKSISSRLLCPPLRLMGGGGAWESRVAKLTDFAAWSQGPSGWRGGGAGKKIGLIFVPSTFAIGHTQVTGKPVLSRWGVPPSTSAI